MTREEAIQRMLTWKELFLNDWLNADETAEVFGMAIEALQDRPTGTWSVRVGNHCGVLIKECYCDQCGHRGGLATVLFDDEPLPKYCSNCGAKMIGRRWSDE